MEITVGDLFSYTLERQEKSDLEKIREQMQSIDADRNAIDRESKLFNYWFFQMGGKSLGATSSSDFFYNTTGIGHTDGAVPVEDED